MSQKIKKILVHFPLLGKLIKDRDHLLEERNFLLKQIENKSNSLSVTEKLQQTSNEILFAHIFSDSIKNCKWIKNKSFSPYQGAANYSFLYKLFKILDVFEPNSILELGLGQTTKLTTQYIAYKNKSSKLLIVDDNEKWINIYKKNINININSKIVKLDTECFTHKKEKTEQSKYSGLKKIIGNKKFDLIIVDGPIGYAKKYPRTNILDLVPNLAKNWIVIIDDAERKGEQNTISLFEEILRKRNIDKKSFYIESIKKQYCASSPENIDILYSI